ncbi:helicase-related protein [Alkalinema pantanalense CENA528]|uniref:helicase-related protein n=1 Tax=Alkalinema pantanalense TaxID=1620705 RepID=UPI003D6FC766
MTNYTPGSIVTCRDRQWIVLPSDSPAVVRLRPLSGSEDEVCGIYEPLEIEQLNSATFPTPQAQSVQDHTAAILLMDAARMSLRSGAGPFRCLGRLSVRPRPYQLVPLLMALRLDTVRLLLADDVGIGKTVEAGLIARELLDRGEIRRIAVLCPPHLCDQWHWELRDKFNIDAVVVRSGTVSKLERQLPNGDHHIFGYYRHVIVSLDYAKSDRRRASFLTHCPDFVIVDEAHTCTAVSEQKGSAQQQRHQLVEAIAAKPERHMVLLTATPHSGIESAFLSLLGLLQPEFEQWNLECLTEQQRDRLASHFVQRRRADVKQWLGNDTPFPERDAIESAYKLSKDYRDLFDQVYGLARGLLTGADGLSYAQQRGRYWAALALIRCVMSSPAAAIATLTRQMDKTVESELPEESLDEALMGAYVYDPTEQEQVVDAAPSMVVEQGTTFYKESERRKLKSFVQAAEKLVGAKDSKFQAVLSIVEGLLKEGLNPIIWCRYIATAEYVADLLRQKLEKKGRQIRVMAITGTHSEDEREIRLEELMEYPQRVMVATDCLSEGVNLQEHFSAVVHYDLPWNPNRLEQREGRIDRYGQPAKEVKSFLLHGDNNPVDQAVLDVLIRKAVEIHKALGITVPVPMDSTSVSEAVFQSLFDRADRAEQLTLFGQSVEAEQLSLIDLLEDEVSAIGLVHKRWKQAVDRERASRTKFAQRAIKPVEVEQELLESDQVLGCEADVERFVVEACKRLNYPLVKQKHGYLLKTIPVFLELSLGNRSRTIAFSTPLAEGVEYIGRNHPLVEGLARYLLEEALDKLEEPTAARCGLVVTDGVEKRTTLLLLRLRHVLEEKHRGAAGQQLLAEECLVAGFVGPPSDPLWLKDEAALKLLQSVEPVADVPIAYKRAEIDELLERLDELAEDLALVAQIRAKVLEQSHCRVRNITKEGQVKVRPQVPMDVLGIYILEPGNRKK